MLAARYILDDNTLYCNLSFLFVFNLAHLVGRGRGFVSLFYKERKNIFTADVLIVM